MLDALQGPHSQYASLLSSRQGGPLFWEPPGALHSIEQRVHEMYIPRVYMASFTLSSRPFSMFLAKHGVEPYWNLSQKEISNTELILTKMFGILFILGHLY